MKKKIKGCGGFSLAETLLAILILLLVSVIVANGIPVARNAYQKVVLTSNAQVLLSTAVNALQDELGTAWDVKVEAITTVNGETIPKAVVYYSASTGARSAIYLDGDPKMILLQENYAISSLGVTRLGDPRILVSDVSNSALSSLYVTYEAVEAIEDGATGEATGIKFTGITVNTKENTPLVNLDELTIGLYFN